MKIKTRFEIHERVWYPRYHENKIESFVIEKIYIEIVRRYSGGGGTVGDDISVRYSDDEGDFLKIPEHQLCTTKKEVEKKLLEYQETFPTKICEGCGSVISVDKT